MTKSTIDRLTSLGEEVLGKASQNPTANRVLQGAMQMKERVDDLSKRVRGLEGMEKRIAELEQRAREARGRREARRPLASSAKKTRYEGVGTRSRSAPGTTSKLAGVVPTCSPSTSIGSRSAASTSTRVERSDLDLRVVHVVALVDLRRRRQEVELADVADQDDVEQAVVRLRAPARASSRRRARRRSRRSRRASGRGARRRRA